MLTLELVASDARARRTHVEVHAFIEELTENESTQITNVRLEVVVRHSARFLNFQFLKKRT